MPISASMKFRKPCQAKSANNFLKCLLDEFFKHVRLQMERA